MMLFEEGKFLLDDPISKYIPLETFSRILNLANDGASVILFGDLPENISGWTNLEARDSAFLKLKNELVFETT